MLNKMVQKRGERFLHNPARRGYVIAYRRQEINHCPGCGRTHWYIGRVSAECAFCTTALPLAEAETSGARGGWRTVAPIARLV